MIRSGISRSARHIGAVVGASIDYLCERRCVVSVACPRCGSTQITSNKPGYSGCSGCLFALLLGPLGLLLGLSGSRMIDITCLKCGKQWRPGAAGPIAVVVRCLVLIGAVVGLIVYFSGQTPPRNAPNNYRPPTPAPEPATRADVSPRPLEKEPATKEKPVNRLTQENYSRVEDEITRSSEYWDRPARRQPRPRPGKGRSLRPRWL